MRGRGPDHVLLAYGLIHETLTHSSVVCFPVIDRLVVIDRVEVWTPPRPAGWRCLPFVYTVTHVGEGLQLVFHGITMMSERLIKDTEIMSLRPTTRSQTTPEPAGPSEPSFYHNALMSSKT